MNLDEVRTRANENKQLGILNRFSSRSANDNKNKHLWCIGADLFIPQINSILEKQDYKMEIVDIQNFKNKKQDELGDLFNDFGSDKAAKHDYYIFYSYILNKLNTDSKLNILEIGLGTNNPNLISNMGITGKPGASLRAFKNFLPNSFIFGADIDKNILFNESRIKTTYVDQLNDETFKDMDNIFGNIKYDLIIDDGLHSICANLNTLIYALDKVKDNGWIVIEDIYLADNWNIIDFILSKDPKYEINIICNKRKRYMFVIHKL
tara:strand:- start:89 stop:880 length:792 start_codon:yes stop_codon:yes gene_type:complete